MDRAISYACYVTVGEALLIQTALLLLPDVYEMFEEKLKEITQKCDIEYSTSHNFSATWLRSRLSLVLQPHLAYKCSVKKSGTILYRHGDLLHALM